MIWGYNYFRKHPYKSRSINRSHGSIMSLVGSPKTSSQHGHRWRQETAIRVEVVDVTTDTRRPEQSSSTLCPFKKWLGTLGFFRWKMEPFEPNKWPNWKGTSSSKPPCLSGWWLNQPIWNICSSKWEKFPKIVGEHKKYLSCHHLVCDLPLYWYG